MADKLTWRYLQRVSGCTVRAGRGRLHRRARARSGAPAGVVKSVNTADLKSAAPHGACGFESRPRHTPIRVGRRTRRRRGWKAGARRGATSPILCLRLHRTHPTCLPSRPSTQDADLWPTKDSTNRRTTTFPRLTPTVTARPTSTTLAKDGSGSSAKIAVSNSWRARPRPSPSSTTATTRAVADRRGALAASGALKRPTLRRRQSGSGRSGRRATPAVRSASARRRRSRGSPRRGR